MIPKRENDSFWIYVLDRKQLAVLKESVRASDQYRLVGDRPAKVYRKDSDMFQGAMTRTNPNSVGMTDPTALIYPRGVVMVDKSKGDLGFRSFLETCD